MPNLLGFLREPRSHLQQRVEDQRCVSGFQYTQLPHASQDALVAFKQGGVSFPMNQTGHNAPAWVASLTQMFLEVLVVLLVSEESNGERLEKIL